MFLQPFLRTIHLVAIGALERVVQAVEMDMAIAHRTRGETTLAVDALEALPLRWMLYLGMLPNLLQVAEYFRTKFALIGSVVQSEEGVVFRFVVVVVVLVVFLIRSRRTEAHIQGTASR